jgi:drug/metabolite transporter (DMT)-like permease
VLFILPVLSKGGMLHFKGNTKKVLIASTINAARMYLYLIAFIYTSIGNAVVLFYTYPLFVAAIETIHFKVKMKRSQTLFLLLAFVGIVITYLGKPFSFESDDFIGMMAAIGASIGYAITVVIFKSETQNYTKDQLIFFQNIVGAFVFLPFIVTLPEAKIEHLGTGVLYGFLIGIVVFKLFFFGLKHLTAATATSLMYLEVVSAILLGYFILDEKLTWNTLLGGGCIVISSFYISRLMGKKSKAEQVNPEKI